MSIFPLQVKPHHCQEIFYKSQPTLSLELLNQTANISRSSSEFPNQTESQTKITIRKILKFSFKTNIRHKYFINQNFHDAPSLKFFKNIYNPLMNGVTSHIFFLGFSLFLRSVATYDTLLVSKAYGKGVGGLYWCNFKDIYTPLNPGGYIGVISRIYKPP